MELTARPPVAMLGDDARAAFVTRTYVHLFGAILLFVGIEFLLFATGLAEPMANAMLSVNWLLVLGAFMIVGTFADRVAARAETKAAQYGALVAFVAAEAVIFVPMLFIAAYYSNDPGVIGKAAWVTLLGFGGLTAIALTTKKDFSFLGSMLKWAFVVAIIAIVAAVLFGFELGTWFSVAMIGLAGASILYQTSNILHHYPEDRYVAASLALFSSVALMFWYVLRLFMSRD